MGTAIVGGIVALDALLADRRVWRGQPAGLPAATQPSGFAALDAALPTGGWPDAALTELLLPADGIGELHLLLPTLARLTRAARDIVLVAPPYVPYPDGWRQAGVDFARLHCVDAAPRDALWAAEQCLRSGSLAAVLCWPRQADDRALRRLQVAAETGQALGFAFRDARAAANPSPAALRLQFEQAGASMRLRVLKCRGGNAPAGTIAFDRRAPATTAGAASSSGSAPATIALAQGQAGLSPASSPAARALPDAPAAASSPSDTSTVPAPTHEAAARATGSGVNVLSFPQGHASMRAAEPA